MIPQKYACFSHRKANLDSGDHHSWMLLPVEGVDLDSNSSAPPASPTLSDEWITTRDECYKMEK